MKYRVHVVRFEEYSDYVEIEAESEEDAADKVGKMLDEDGGWDTVFPGDNDGEYLSCWSEVAEVEEVTEEEDNKPV